MVLSCKSRIIKKARVRKACVNNNNNNLKKYEKKRKYLFP